jgi:hypothetical protein
MKTLKPRQKGVRRGVGIVECIILMVILGISVAAIMTTMGWASRTYAFSKDDLDRRTLLFNWCQAFESFFPGVTDDIDNACRRTTEFLGGSWDTSTKRADFKRAHFTVTSTSATTVAVAELEIKMYRQAGGTADVSFLRHFNRISSETVSDDSI